MGSRKTSLPFTFAGSMAFSAVRSEASTTTYGLEAGRGRRDALPPRAATTRSGGPGAAGVGPRLAALPVGHLDGLGVHVGEALAAAWRARAHATAALSPGEPAIRGPTPRRRESGRPRKARVDEPFRWRTMTGSSGVAALAPASGLVAAARRVSAKKKVPARRMATGKYARTRQAPRRQRSIWRGGVPH